jgi:hypothetical protein
MGAQIPVIAEKPTAVCGCRKFQIDHVGDHLNTCTTHSGAKKAHDWAVDQLADLSRVLDLRIAQKYGSSERYGSSSGPSLSLNGNLHYPNDLDRSLNEAAADKIRKYRADYNNNPPRAVSFMPAISASTSGRLHSEFIRLLFLQAHRETDRFFVAVGSTLAKAAALCVNLNIDGAPITSRTHTESPITLANISSINLVPIFRCSSSNMTRRAFPPFKTTLKIIFFYIPLRQL